MKNCRSCLSKRLKRYRSFLSEYTQISMNILSGMWKLTRVPHPTITIFGGSKIKDDSRYASMAAELAERLAHAGFSIITGGGPGIMEAANRGAMEHLEECKQNQDGECRTFVSVGVGLSNLKDESINQHVQDPIIMKKFFARKWLLTHYAHGFAIFPGGFGTLDELFEVVTLIQTEHMRSVPVVLIGLDFWKPLMQWIENHPYKEGLLSAEDKQIISCVDTVDEAFETLKLTQ